MAEEQDEFVFDFDDLEGRRLIVEILVVVALALSLLIGSACWFIHQEQSDAQVNSLVVAQHDYGIWQLKIDERPTGHFAGQAWYFVPELGQNCTSPFSYYEVGHPSFLARLLHAVRRIKIYLELETCIPTSLPVSSF